MRKKKALIHVRAVGIFQKVLGAGKKMRLLN